MPIAAGLVIAAGLLVGLTVTGGPGSPRAAAFSLPRLGGPPVAYPLTGGKARVPVVLTFFASWCGPCHRELPMIARVANQQQATRDRVVFLGVDGNDDPSSGLSFARHSRVSFPVGEDASSEVAPRFTLVGYPGTVFIDPSGNVVGTVHGPLSRSLLERWLARLSHP